jgi:hypothetical protein
MNDEPSSEAVYLRQRLDELETEYRNFLVENARDIGRLRGWKERVDADLKALTQRLDRLIERSPNNPPASQGAAKPPGRDPISHPDVEG